MGQKSSCGDPSVGVRHLWDRLDPFRFGWGNWYAQRADPMINAGIFTQVWAARMRKTLLLLWFIDGV
jgi:hypothetical protein